MTTTALDTTHAEPDLLSLSGIALDELSRAAAAGPIPRNFGSGTAIVLPGRTLGRWLARFVQLTAWQGKHFDADGQHLTNCISPFRARAVRAAVYEDASWLDGRPSIFIDYSKTSGWRAGCTTRSGSSRPAATSVWCTYAGGACRCGSSSSFGHRDGQILRILNITFA